MVDNYPVLKAIHPLKEEFGFLSEIQINSVDFKIGKSVDNSMIISDPVICDEHCVIRRNQEGRWSIEDLSATGIRINDVILEKDCPRDLEPNCVIQLDENGNFKFEFIADEGSSVSDYKPSLEENTTVVEKPKDADQEQMPTKAEDLVVHEPIVSDVNDIEITESEVPGTSTESNDAAAVKQKVLTDFGAMVEDELQCLICSNLFITPITLNCSHTFCKYCIAEWKKKQLRCPICRTGIFSECRSLVLESFIDRMVSQLTEDMKEKRLQILTDRQELEKQTAKAELTAWKRFEEPFPSYNGLNLLDEDSLSEVHSFDISSSDEDRSEEVFLDGNAAHLLALEPLIPNAPVEIAFALLQEQINQEDELFDDLDYDECDLL